MTGAERLAAVRKRYESAAKGPFAVEPRPAVARWYFEDVPWLLGLLDAAREENQRKDETLAKAADDLERMVANNKRGPEYGWTHPDESADTLRRHVGLVIADLRAGLPDTNKEGTPT